MILDTATIRLLLLLVALLLCALPVAAQVVGDCQPGTAEAELDINDVRASVFNAGTQFFSPFADPTFGKYYVPAAKGHYPFFSDGLLIAGLEGGDLRAASAIFGSDDFWPGPLDSEGRPPADCATYDRVWRVSRAAIARFYETGEATADLRDWPADLGAPVLDGDGVQGNYNLAGGDEPAISGEQMAWWVMNDRGNEHEASRTASLGVEVQVSAFAAPSLVMAVHQATVHRYRIVNRSTEAIDSMYVGFFGFMDLGDAVGNLAGSDTTRGMAYVYHQDIQDNIYGFDLPAFGRLYLDTPAGDAGEPLGMTASMFFFNGASLPQQGNVFAPDVYRYLQGRWGDGTPITEGGDGYESGGPVTTFMFAGDPLEDACWSTTNVCNGPTEIQSQGRSLSATGPFRLAPGASAEVAFALVFAQGGDNEDSLVELRVAADYVANAYEVGFFDPQRIGAGPEPPPVPDAFGLSRPFPNPFGSTTSLTLTVPEGASTARLSVFDVLGREVVVLAEGVLPPGEQTFTLDGAGLPSGVYLVRLATARQTETLMLVHVE